MEYRIKIIRKYSGDHTFIPEYRKDDWIFKLGIKIIFSPLMLLLWLIFDKDIKWRDISEYFNMWNNIPYNAKTFEEHFKLDSDLIISCTKMEDAEQAIKTHKQDMQYEFNREQKAKLKVEMDKTEKVLYVKVK